MVEGNTSKSGAVTGDGADADNIRHSTDVTRSFTTEMETSTEESVDERTLQCSPPGDGGRDLYVSSLSLKSWS